MLTERSACRRGLSGPGRGEGLAHRPRVDSGERRVSLTHGSLDAEMSVLGSVRHSPPAVDLEVKTQ
jgi:hypothetical protein